MTVLLTALALRILVGSGLDSLGTRLEETRILVADLESRQAAVSEILLAIHEHLMVARQYYDELESREESLVGSIGEIDDRFAREESLRSVLSGSVSDYLVYVYAHRRMLGAEALFCTGGLSRVLRREAYLEYMARRAAVEESALRTTTDSLTRYRDSLLTLQGEVSSLRRQMEIIRDRIVYEEERQALLRLQLGSELARAMDSASTLESERQRVSSLVNDLRTASTTVSSVFGTQPSGSGVFDTARGSIDWPAEGEVVRRFGLEVHPVYGTETTCDGVSVATAASGQVCAVSGGRVLYARDFLSMGRLVVVDHQDGYFTVYGHLGSVLVEPGETVAQGDPVGLSGSLPDGTSGYYFEIRKGGQPVDPEAYLR